MPERSARPEPEGGPAASESVGSGGREARAEEQGSTAISARRALPATRRRGFFSFSRGQVIVGLVLCLVAVAVTMQVRAQSTDDTYATARRADLVQILDGLNAESRRLDDEISNLENTRDELRSGVDSERIAREEAMRREEDLSILAGTRSAVGPGVRIVIEDPNAGLTDVIMIDTIQELRDSGAEAIEINDAVRVVASTWVSRSEDGLIIDGVAITAPYAIDAIGDANALAEATRFPGGLVSEVENERIGGEVRVDQPTRITVTSLHTVRENQYARPAR
ncbi:DUF881 domain-containing protein [Naumannella halotolerans]|uniref:DUF881 domain-containing protein n=1 Tax=Naumannella halotolerans TaxID=993414 RepID=UPI00370D1A91